MKIPSESKIVRAADIPDRHLCQITVDNKVLLAFSYTYSGVGHNKSFFLINGKRHDDSRIYVLKPEDIFLTINDLGEDFSIKVSQHTDNAHTTYKNEEDNILACAKPSKISNTTQMSYMLVNRTALNTHCIDINTGTITRLPDTNVEYFHSWKILDRDGEIIYSYPPANSGSASQN